MNESLRQGTKLYAIAFIIGIVTTVLGMAVAWLLPLLHGDLLAFFKWESYAFTAIGITGAALLIAGTTRLRPVASERATVFLNGVFVCAVLRIVLVVLGLGVLSGSLVWTLSNLMFTGNLLAAWLALRALAQGRKPAFLDATPFVVTALLIGFALDLANQLSVRLDYRTSIPLFALRMLPVAAALFDLMVYGVLLRRARALATSVLEKDAPEIVGAPIHAPPPSPGNDFVVGAIWLVGGILVTGISYAAAQGGGGHYIVTTGAIAYGLARIIRGATRR